MQYLLDAILIILFAALAVRGFRKGFVKSVLSAGKLLLAILLTVTLGARISDWVDRSFVNPPIYEAVHTKLAGMATAAGAQSDEFCQSMLDRYGAYVDKASLEEQVKAGNESIDQLAERYSTSISHAISGAVSTVIGYLLTFLAALLVLTLLIWLISRLTQLPVLKQCDKLAGLGLGLVSGFLAVSLLATILWALLYATGSLDVYDRTYLVKFFKEMKLFQFILDKMP